MPPTFTAADGNIEYFARVIVQYRDEGSMEGNEVCCEAQFVMKKSISNFPVKFLQLVQIKEQLTFPKFLSRPTTIDVMSKMPKRIYHRGEIIRLTCDYKVVNGADRNVSGVYAVLMQGLNVVKQNGQERTKRREIKRAPPFHGDGEEGSSKWSDIYMDIPSDISLTVQGCGNITIFYYVQVRAKKSKETIDIPIVIIDNENELKQGKSRERRLSLTGSSMALPSMFQTFSTFDRDDPIRASKSSIESHRLYYNDS